jgi:hypothetical protein
MSQNHVQSFRLRPKFSGIFGKEESSRGLNPQAKTGTFVGLKELVKIRTHRYG